jgi:ankyrin repeat protein
LKVSCRNSDQKREMIRSLATEGNESVTENKESASFQPASKGVSSFIRRAPLLIFLIALCVFSGCTPSIHESVARGNEARVKDLLDKDPALIGALDAKEKTPLHRAVTYKQMDMLNLLLERGADLNAQDVTGMTPLHVAAMLGRRDEAEWLLDHGADPEIKDSYGDLPIHTAAVFGHGQIISLFTNRGMSLDIKNAAGESLEEIAHEYRQERVAAYVAHLKKK